MMMDREIKLNELECISFHSRLLNMIAFNFLFFFSFLKNVQRKCCKKILLTFVWKDINEKQEL